MNRFKLKVKRESYPVTISFCLLILSFYFAFSQLFCLISIFPQDFLAHSKKKSYLCGRETISNDISDQFSTAKKSQFLCLFQCFIFGSFRYFANTHTHTQAHLAFNHTFFLSSYARAKRGVTLVNKGLIGVSFVRFFVPVCELSRKQNKNVLSIDFTAKDICNSLVIVCFLSLISRAGSSNALSACREGENGRLRDLYNEFIRMYI